MATLRHVTCGQKKDEETRSHMSGNWEAKLREVRLMMALGILGIPR